MESQINNNIQPCLIISLIVKMFFFSQVFCEIIILTEILY